MTSRTLVAELLIATPLCTAAAAALVPHRLLTRAAALGAALTGAFALALVGITLRHPLQAQVGHWVTVDAAAALLVGVIGLVGVASVLVSPSYLRTMTGSVEHLQRRERGYFCLLFAFWATALAVPLAGNLALAWLLVEGTTATSALLVGFSGKPRALEAGWKYLILTSLGLGIALLGVGLLAADVPGHGLAGLSWKELSRYSGTHEQALVAYLLVLAGLAAKIGWAPVHNWLPDAHSEAPPPVSALLSGALLPAVLLVAWRVEQALAPVLGRDAAQHAMIGFGMVSVAVAVPFLWQPLGWKRLLAYSSLEHMGVIALGIGFGTPLALAGVAVHIVGHAVAKALGFYAAIPLLDHEPRSGGHAAVGIGRSAPPLGAAMGISLGSLAGLPPSPLFASELLILAGGFASGHALAAAIATVLLALGFLGLAHTLLEVVAGKSRRHNQARPAGLAPVVRLAGVSVALLLGLAAVAFALPSTAFISALMRGAA
ncbi:MAG: proton-conducting transporter transmembrane domain-containing protein [Mycobacteriales bacterium]